MKIDPLLNSNIIRSYQALTPVKGAKKVDDKKDEVTFSEEALSFSKAMEDARGAMETRSTDERARITDLANAIKRGDYYVSSDKVADKILESVFRK